MSHMIVFSPFGLSQTETGYTKILPGVIPDSAPPFVGLTRVSISRSIYVHDRPLYMVELCLLKIVLPMPDLVSLVAIG